MIPSSRLTIGWWGSIFSSFSSVGLRLVVLSQTEVEIAQREVDPGRVGIQGDGFLVFFDRLVQSSLGRVSLCQQLMSAEGIRIDLFNSREDLLELVVGAPGPVQVSLGQRLKRFQLLGVFPGDLLQVLDALVKLLQGQE